MHSTAILITSLLLLVSVLIYAFPAVADGRVIKVLSQNSQPKFIMQDTVVRGLCGDIYTRLQERLNAKGLTPHEFCVDAGPGHRIYSN